jgi:hypothetical protein
MNDIPCDKLNSMANQLFEEIRQQELSAGEPGVIPHLQAQLKLRLIHALITEHRVSCLICEESLASRMAKATAEELLSAVA